jgi:hypothetical protein
MKLRTLSLGMCVVLGALAAGAAAAEKTPAREPKIQVALLLDDSGSMSGLINQAKAQLWKFVNELATSKKGGRPPTIEVALQLHGGPVRPVIALTDDLDLLSEKLFAVAIHGNGAEPCGEAIKAAVEGLAWSDSPEDLKVIFLAGNEEFTQGSVNYKDACKMAVAKGILVNTIHCGSGIPDDWKDGALLAEGIPMNIDQAKALPYIEAPQDKEIVRLGEELNGTYIPFGANGAAGLRRQQEQNGNAARMSAETNVQRFVAQSQVQYRNGAWDLVDAVNEGKVKVADLKAEDLPENLRKMTAEERKAFVEANQKRRDELQKQIQQLNGDRAKYVAAKQKALAAGDESLDSAMIKTLRTQAAKREFEFAAAPSATK